MPRIRQTGNTDAAEEHMSLVLDCWSDELSPAQLVAYETAESEHFSICSKLNEIVASGGGENVFLGEIFSAYQIPGAATAVLEEIAKPLAAVRKENRARQQIEEKKSQLVQGRRQPQQRVFENSVTIPDDDEDDLPIARRTANLKVAKLAAERKKAAELAARATPGRRPATIPSASPSGSNFRPMENTSIGGLSVGDSSRNKKDIVDLTKDEPVTKGAPDSREVTFNKLQGKTFPSLVVVARPTLKVKENVNDRPVLDAKVKSVLMHTATKFTEWLIQQGLVRSEQTCQIHPGKSLKLGMYSDASKFAYSGGYVWISDCCPTRFVSVFNGSMFEGAPHAPSVLLKLIYHWSCQTNVQNVVQWVKIENLYVKGLYTILRSVCTVALSQHMTLLGGRNKRIEVGVISLGTTGQGGASREVKVEVLGVLDFESKMIRLRAVEPINDGETNYKKRFAKILGPLPSWVHKESMIMTDPTVDKGTLHLMGYRNVHQTPASSTSDGKTKNFNANIMDYLRRIVPRMFQNTLSLLSRQIIQQFLDELVWREWYGTTPNQTFDNIVSHISEQTRLDVKEPLIVRLNKVAANPFLNWSHLSVKTPAKALRENFFTGASSSPVASPGNSQQSTPAPAKRGRKRREPSPEYVPYNKKIVIKEEPRSYGGRKIETKATAAPIEQFETPTYLESYYYGISMNDVPNDSARPANNFRAQCPECCVTFHSNVTLMDHLKQHAYVDPAAKNTVQCIYCLEMFPDNVLLDKHTITSHPKETKSPHGSGLACLICEVRSANVSLLIAHMQKSHVTLDLPYSCGCCSHTSSSLRYTIDHFYGEHSTSGMLQCPFCMQVFCAQDMGGKVLNVNIREYLEHLKNHLYKSPKKCGRCVLSFVTKGSLKVHHTVDHCSAAKKKVIPLTPNRTKIFKPKYKYNYSNIMLNVVRKRDFVRMVVDNGHMCLECGVDFEEKRHFPGLMKCPKCKYHTSCSRTMIEHSTDCTGNYSEPTAAPPSPLDQEMHCICGFSSHEGNALARHLVTCGRRSAYPTVEVALENTVKRNMLDMLGLVRRGDDDIDDGTIVLDSDGIQSGPEIEEPPPLAEVESSNAVDDNQPAAPEAMEGVEQGVAADDQEHQFNTELSLDDLAGPASVAASQLAETDRTPQLTDEYQSLATPRVSIPIEGDVDHLQKQQIESFMESL